MKAKVTKRKRIHKIEKKKKIKEKDLKERERERAVEGNERRGIIVFLNVKPGGVYVRGERGAAPFLGLVWSELIIGV